MSHSRRIGDPPSLCTVLFGFAYICEYFIKMADLLIKTDRLRVMSPPPVFVKDSSLSVHNYTNPRNLQHQSELWQDSEAASSAVLYCMCTLCHVCVHVRGWERFNLQLALKVAAVMKKSQSNEGQYKLWQKNSFSTPRLQTRCLVWFPVLFLNLSFPYALDCEP